MEKCDCDIHFENGPDRKVYFKVFWVDPDMDRELMVLL